MNYTKDLLPHQYDFVFCDEPHPAMQGGLGSGKSEAGVLRVLRLMLENNDANFLYAMPTYDLLRLRAIPAFEEFFINANMTYKLNKSESTIQADGFGQIIFRSYDNPKRIIAFEVFAAIVDEIDTLKKDEASYVWRKVTERVRQAVKSEAKNSIAVVTTPDQGYNGFLYEKWHKMKQDGYVVYKASTYDNPFLPDGYIDNILNNYDPILADLYLRGEIVSLNQNKVYHFYNRINHHTTKTIDDFTHIHIGLDFNVGGTVAIVFGIENNIPYAIDEFVSYDTFDFINNLSRFNGKNIIIYPDASGQNRKTNASQTDVDMIIKAGYSVYVNSQNPAVRDRINSVNGMISHNRMFINSDKCPNLSSALESQGYTDKGEPEKWNTHPAADDFNDAMGYFIAYRYPINSFAKISGGYNR